MIMEITRKRLYLTMDYTPGQVVSFNKLIATPPR